MLDQIQSVPGGANKGWFTEAKDRGNTPNECGRPERVKKKSGRTSRVKARIKAKDSDLRTEEGRPRFVQEVGKTDQPGLQRQQEGRLTLICRCRAEPARPRGTRNLGKLRHGPVVAAIKSREDAILGKRRGSSHCRGETYGRKEGGGRAGKERGKGDRGEEIRGKGGREGEGGG